MSQLSVCNFCNDNILRSTKSWDFHHPCFASLARSASNRCAFCAPLHEQVLHARARLSAFRGAKDGLPLRWLDEDVQRTNEFPSSDRLTTALYRWSIRGLGRTREGKEMVAVTFRVIPQVCAKQDENENGKVLERKDGDGSAASESTIRPRREKMETFGLPQQVFYCFPEADLGGLLSKSDLGVSTNPETNDGLQIKRWIQRCDHEHKYCPAQLRQQRSGGFVPTRLLLVGTRGSTEPIKVVETKPNNIRGPYITLSHCWGVLKGERKDTLLRKNKDVFMSVGVPWTWLSRNFQQAIEVARFLEMTYIWIDSLCIIQGDKEDWLHEGQLMHKVYRHSYCNIAAADSEDSTGGLFRSREAWQVLPPRFVTDGKNKMFGSLGRAWRVVKEDLWKDGLLQTPLYIRGWVFQERMLAPRILHFGAHQIFWDCAEMSACETLPDRLPLPLDYDASADRHWRGRLQESGGNRLISVSGKNDDSMEDFWKAAVKNYTSCNLTNQTDKRIAIWGIAKLVRDSLQGGEEYAAGMWEHHLEEQLAWTVADWRTAERPESLLSNPTWSWTSVKGTVLLVTNRSRQQGVYTVKNHNGEPISFRVERSGARPLPHREGSETLREEIAIMGEELETVAVKRKVLSRKSTLRFSDNSNGTSKQSPTMQGNTDSYFPPEQPPHVSVSASASQDKEPILLDNSIPIQGYINHGTLRWSETAQKWSLEIQQWKDAVVDAFPDSTSYANEGATAFLILALSQYSGPHQSLALTSEPTEDSWYSGVGILIRPSPGNTGRFVRTGALQVRSLSAEAWHGLQGAYKSGDGAGTKFVLE